MKLLDIIITLTRNHKNLEVTLDSIEKIKHDKNISVIILSNEVNIKKELLRQFKFESKVIQSRKTFGPLYQEVLDGCKCEYITFIDAGDKYDTNGLRQVIDFLNGNKANVLRTDLAENYIGLDGRPAVGIVNYSFVETPHAHFFRNEYLKGKNIKFNEKLDIYALDNFYRNALYNAKIIDIKTTTYLSSFTAIQYDKNHLPINVENIDEYYESIIDTFEMLQKNNNDYYQKYLLTVLFSLFIIVESVDFSIPTLQEKKREYEEKIYFIYLDYKDIYDEIDNKIKNKKIEIEFEKQRRTNINLKVICSFEDLLSKMNNIKAEYQKTEPRFLDIIVPEYEGEEFIFDFLNSLEKQKNVNFEEIGVVIVNDDSPHKIKPYKFKRYGNINVEYIINEKNVGQGMTRQHGIDHSKAEYITMFDQDDIFYDKDDYCLSKIIAALKTHSPNALLGNVVEQNKFLGGEELRIVYKSTDPMVFVHGFYLKRKYLIEKNIRFNPRLRQLEDTYFSRIVMATTEVFPIDVDVYFWRNNRKSQVRSSKKEECNFTVLNFDYFAICGEDIFEFLKDKNYEFGCKYLIASLFGMYFISNSEYALPIGEKRVKEMQKATYQFYIRFKKIYDEQDEKVMDSCYNDEKASLSRSMPGIKPLESFDEFIIRMSREYPDI